MRRRWRRVKRWMRARGSRTELAHSYSPRQQVFRLQSTNQVSSEDDFAAIRAFLSEFGRQSHYKRNDTKMMTFDSRRIRSTRQDFERRKQRKQTHDAKAQREALYPYRTKAKDHGDNGQEQRGGSNGARDHHQSRNTSDPQHDREPLLLPEWDRPEMDFRHAVARSRVGV